jgi:DNA-binding HxlR family transcriptional regulator
MIKIQNNRSGCPVSTALELIGDKWTLVIIRDLFLQNITFKDFMNSPEKISSNILTNRLKKLKKYNLINFFANPEDKKIKHYYLREAGVNLYPMIYNLSIWSKKNISMAFNSTAVEWYDENLNKEQEITIKKTIDSYKIFRNNLMKQFKVQHSES